MALSGSLIYSDKGFTYGAVGGYAAVGCVLPANSLIVVQISDISDTSGVGTFTVSNSTGTALTWTKKASTVSGATTIAARADTWVAQNTAGQTVTINVTATVNVFSADGVPSTISISAWTGHDTTTPVGLTAVDQLNGSHTGTLNFSLGGTASASSVIIANIACDGDYFSATVDGGSGYTELYKTNSGTNGWYRGTFEYKAGALTSVDFGALNDPYQYAAAAIEIKAAGGGGGPAFLAQQILPILQAVKRASFW